MPYLASYLVLQSEREREGEREGERESLLLYFNCLLGFMWLLMFCVSSSRCPGLVCSV